ncbi:DUF1534 domain-containing protein [Pseudomonas congelans]|nr:DUF1534 domain-containing protein [Pseudomonas congelans]
MPCATASRTCCPRRATSKATSSAASAAAWPSKRRSVTASHVTRSGGTIVIELSFLTLQRGNAVRDAPRHRFRPHRRL